MELVATLVRDERMLDAAEREARAGDPVGVAADDAAHVAAARLVALDRVEADDVDGPRRIVDELEPRERRAVAATSVTL